MAVYGQKDQSEITVEILDALQRNAGISAVYPGSIARAFAEAIGTEIAQLYSSLSFSLRQSSLSTASGVNLDMIGELYGVSRKTISDASAVERQSFNIEFILDKPHSADIIIPKNTYVYTNVDNFSVRQYRFKLNGEVIIPPGSTRSYGLVVPDFSDSSYTAPVNSLTKHNFVAPPGVILYCNNPKEVYAIINAESDDNYRRRIVAALKTQAVGSAESVRFAALTIPGVRDVKIRESSFGVGSCDIIVVPENGSNIKRLPELVYNTIVSVKPVGVRFNVRIAEQIAINVSASIVLNSGITENMALGIKNQATLFARRYLNSLSIGDVVSISEIERQIRLASDAIRQVTINGFNVDGKEIPLQDFSPTSNKVYPTAGSVAIYSVIMGQSNY
jgi:uncharacterized phage protein gp47/JayE